MTLPIHPRRFGRTLNMGMENTNTYSFREASRLSEGSIDRMMLRQIEMSFYEEKQDE